MPDLLTETAQQAQRVLTEACQKIANCLRQLDNKQIWWRPAEGMNSIGNLLLHLNGNVRQWLIDGLGLASYDRNRPGEFSANEGDGQQAFAQLRETVTTAQTAITACREEDWLTERRIQGFQVTGAAAIWDSVSHFVGHTHQIIQLTRLQLGDRYQYQWAPSSPEEMSG